MDKPEYIGRNATLQDMEFALIRDPVERKAARKRAKEYVQPEQTEYKYFEAQQSDAQRMANLLVDMANDPYNAMEHMHHAGWFWKLTGEPIAVKEG